MEITRDLSRWREAPRGLSYRWWIIVSTGVRQASKTKIFRSLLVSAWMSGLLIAAMGFLFSQSVSSGGWLETWASHLNPRFQAIVSAFTAFVLLFPEICIGGFFTLTFWLHSWIGLWLSLVALTVLVPRLVTQDRATNALTVYLSRPLTSTDYLLGKLGIIASVLALMWTGPLLAGWLLSMIFSPDRDFIVYSFKPLLHALLFNGIGLAALAMIALGVSATGRTSRNTVMLWMGLWLVLGSIAKIPEVPDWIKRASFTHDLSQVRQGVFGLESVFADSAATLPLIGTKMVTNLTTAATMSRATDFYGALGALAAFAAVSLFVFSRKLRTE